jgi:8-oxo-dGTP diphosphatase
LQGQHRSGFNENLEPMVKFNTERYIPNLSIDCVIFGYKDGALKALISKFKFGKNLWSLPGGYILKTESTDGAARRILKERTDLDNIYLEQFRVFGEANRITGSEHKEVIESGLKKFDKGVFDAKTTKWMTARFVCIGYYALVEIDKVHPAPGMLEEHLEWRSIKDIPKLTHDHNEIVTLALEALRQNLDQKLIGFNLLPETFTMKEVQELYEAVYDKAFARNNFQKKILDLNVLERLEKKFTGAANKAPYLYQFRSRSNQ